MPKSKPSQVIVHRIELQETERAALEAALAGRFVTNGVSAIGSVLTGIGSMLVPFAGVLTAIGAAYIAEKGIEKAIESVGTITENAKTFADFVNPSKQMEIYQYICAYLQACDGWEGNPNSLRDRINDLGKDLQDKKAHPVLAAKFAAWYKQALSRARATGSYPPESPAKSWIKFYTPQQYAADTIQWAKDALNPF
jgi:hypothetical protein